MPTPKQRRGGGRGNEPPPGPSVMPIVERGGEEIGPTMQDQKAVSPARASDNRAPRSPVFVVGSPRSGTTILASSLRRAGYRGFNEGHLLSLLVPLAETINQHFAEYDADDPDQLLANVNREHLRQEIFQVIRWYQSRYNASEPWFDKTPDAAMIRAVPYIAQLWPGARFIFAKRRAIENVTSRMKKFLSTPFERHCRYWAESMTVWRAVRETGINFVEIDQHDIATDPKGVAARIGEFLDVAGTGIEGMCEEMSGSRPESTDENSTHRVMSIETSGWSPSQIEAFCDLCGAEMKHYGYALDERYYLNSSAVETAEG